MLANMNDVLLPAKKGKYAIGLFNAVDLELARGIIAAAESSGSAVIMGTAEVLLAYTPLEEVSYYLLPMAKKAKVPVVVHLDHGLKWDTCIKALELGFSSIMYDCSTLSYEENIKQVKAMAEIAHSYGATIEGELGHVGDNEGSMEKSGTATGPERFFTDPKQAKDYVDRTGVDALAIAVGNAHGAYKLPPKLDFKRIETIANTVEVPLVLHGGSGLSDDDFRQAIAKGISKVNIFTDINIAAVEAALREFHTMNQGIIALIPAVVEAVKQETLKKLELFGSVNRYGLPAVDRAALIESITKEVITRLKEN